MIHNKMKEYIEKNKIVQKLICEKTGISEAAMCELLNGRRKIEINEYLAICNALNIHYSFFIDECRETESIESA